VAPDRSARRGLQQRHGDRLGPAHDRNPPIAYLPAGSDKEANARAVSSLADNSTDSASCNQIGEIQPQPDVIAARLTGQN